MKLNKLLVGSILFVFFLSFFYGAGEISLIRNSEIFPSNHNWNPDSENTTTSAVWTVYNNTSNALELDEIYIKAEGTVDDTSFILDFIYEKEGIESKYNKGVFLLDNGTILIQVQDGKAVIPANDFIYLKIDYAVNSGESVNENEFFYNYLKSIEATDLVTSSTVSWNATGNGLSSAVITIKKPSVYVLELVGENGTISWVTNYEDVYIDGNSIKSANYINEDFLFRIYKNCALFVGVDGTGSQSKITFYSPIGQSFLSDSEDFSAVAVKLRSTGLNTPENIIARIRRDSINGEILKESSKVVNPVLYDSWILFEFESCGESVCGNNVIETGEECDGDYLNGKSCSALDGFVQGALACSPNCEYDTSSCMSEEEYAISTYCGNGTIDTKYEECDTSDFGNKTCVDYQFDSGDLVCNTQCKIDSTNCFNENVEPINNPNEQNNQDSDEVDTDNGIDTGNDEDDNTNNNTNSICGNNILEIGENCDTNRLGGKTCIDFGFSGGELSCSVSCAYDFSNCFLSNNTNDAEPNEDNDSNATNIDNNRVLDNNSVEQNTTNTTSDSISLGNQNPFGPVFDLKNPDFGLLIGAAIIGLLFVVGACYFLKNKKKFKNK